MSPTGPKAGAALCSQRRPGRVLTDLEMPWLCSLILGVAILVNWLALPAMAQGSASAAEEPSATASGSVAEDGEVAESFPDRSAVGPRYLGLVEAAAADRRRLTELADTADLENDLEEARQRGDELAEVAEAVLAAPRGDLDGEAQVRQALNRHREEVADLVERSAWRIAEADEVRDRWVAARQLWLGWRQDLDERGTLEEFAADFERADLLIDGMLNAVEGTVSELAATQDPLRQLQETSLAWWERLEGDPVPRHTDLLRRDAPALPTPAYFAAMGDREGWRAMGTSMATLRWPDRSYFSAVAPRLALQLLLGVAVFLLARRFRRRFPDAETRWRVLLSHPLAIGVFVASAFAPLLYEAPPPLWRLLQLSLLAASAAVLTPGTFLSPRKRRVAYALAAVFVLMAVLDTLALPGPAFRLFTLLAAGFGVPFLLHAERGEVASTNSGGGFVLLLRLGAMVLLVVLASQLIGFAGFAGWLLENTLTSAFIAFTTVFLLRLGKGALRATLRRPRTESRAGRRLTVRRVGHELLPQLIRGLEAVLVVMAGLYILVVWGVFESPWLGWQELTTAGFDLAGHRITVAQILLGILAVYLAFAASRLTRAMVWEELGRRPELEPGVADSVSTLAHYGLVVVGFFVALAVLGFDLSSFAIVAGALGVGIGFGLQNMVNNFLSGLILLFERPVRVGDVVVIDGQWATIRKIGLRATVVTTFDQADVIVPNGDLVSEKVTNWTLTDTKTRIVLHVGVAYGSDLEVVFRILRGVVEEDPRVASDPPPLVHFEAFGDSSLDFVLRVWVVEIQERLNVRSDLLREIDQRFREAGVTVPFPQRDVHLRPEPPPAEPAVGEGPVD